MDTQPWEPWETTCYLYVGMGTAAHGTRSQEATHYQRKVVVTVPPVLGKEDGIGAPRIPSK
jgi:hypothetical protein